MLTKNEIIACTMCMAFLRGKSAEDVRAQSMAKGWRNSGTAWYCTVCAKRLGLPREGK